MASRTAVRYFERGDGQPRRAIGASVSVVHETIRPCIPNSGYPQALVVIEVVNSGSRWAEIEDCDYTVYGMDSSVFAAGTFFLAERFPNRLGPDATGYLAKWIALDISSPKEVERVEVDGTYRDSSRESPIGLEAANVRLMTRSWDGGLYTTGTVTNTSRRLVKSARVCSIFFDTKGRPLGHSSTIGRLSHLRAGFTKGFETSPPGCAIPPATVHEVVTVVVDETA